jgi:hypothetical protein
MKQQIDLVAQEAPQQKELVKLSVRTEAQLELGLQQPT